MDKSKSLTVAEPTIPGLLPDRPIADMLATFEVDVDANYKIVANKLPTVVQRQMLETRREHLSRALAPASQTAQAQAEMIKIVALWLGGYPRLAHADNVGMAKAYADHLKALPLFAVRRAIESIKNRTARRYDRSVKAEVALDPDEVPSSSRVFDLAKKEMRAADGEAFKIDRLLAAKSTMDGGRPDDPAMRKRVGDMLKQHAEDMRRGSVFAKEIRDQMEEENRRAAETRDRIVRESNLARDRAILADYERLGIEPQYSSPGVLLSPELARIKVPKKGKGRRA